MSDNNDERRSRKLMYQREVNDHAEPTAAQMYVHTLAIFEEEYIRANIFPFPFFFTQFTTSSLVCLLRSFLSLSNKQPPPLLLWRGAILFAAYCLALAARGAAAESTVQARVLDIVPFAALKGRTLKKPLKTLAFAL